MSVTYVNTSFKSDICRFVLPIVVTRGDLSFVMGSAVMIAPGLAMTARHVIDECLQVYHGVPSGPHEGTTRHEVTFNLQLFQFLDSGTTGLVWTGRRINTSAVTDIAFIELLAPAGARAQPSLSMTVAAPLVGEQVFAFGYARGAIQLEDVNQHRVALDPRTTSGRVIEVHELRRDRSMMPYPCFHTDAVFDAGMSGGPVFNSAGKICGIISTSTPPADGSPWSSFAALLWPAFATRISMNRSDRQVEPAGYPVLELAQANLLYLDGWERIAIVDDPSAVALRTDSSRE